MTQRSKQRTGEVGSFGPTAQFANIIPSCKTEGEEDEEEEDDDDDDDGGAMGARGENKHNLGGEHKTTFPFGIGRALERTCSDAADVARVRGATDERERGRGLGSGRRSCVTLGPDSTQAPPWERERE